MKSKAFFYSKKIFIVFIFSCLCSSSLIAQLANSPWPMYGHDERHTYLSPYKGPDSVRVAWIFESEDGILSSSPVIDEDMTIYFNTVNYLKAVDRSGRFKWSYRFEGSPYSQPQLCISSDGTIYVARSLQPWEKCLFAFTKNGNLKWKFKIEDITGSAPVIGQDGTIYIGYSKGILAVNPNGTLKWKYDTGHSIWSSPAIGADGTIYIGSDRNNVPTNAYLYAFNIDGSLKWKFNSGYSSKFSPSIDFLGNIYFSVSNGFYSFNQDGSLKWQSPYKADMVAIGPDGTIYGKFFLNYQLSLIAFDPESGNIKWENKEYVGSRYLSMALDSTGTIYNAFNSTLVAIDKNGILKWRYDGIPGMVSTTTPIILGADKTIYLIIEDNKLCALAENPWAGPPEIPQNLRATPGHTKVTLSWSPNNESDLSFYCIYRSLINNFEPSASDSIASVAKPNTIYIDSGLQFGTTYYYRICAVDSTEKRSEFTSCVGATPFFDPNFLKVLAPENNIFVNRSPIIVKGIAITPYLEKVTVNNIPVPIVNDTFKVEIDLNEGLNEITVIGFDSSDTAVLEQKIKIKLDSILPQVKITTPIPGQSMNYSPIQIKGRFVETNIVSLKINNIKSAISGTNFSLGSESGEGIEINEGINWIKAIAIDSAGNQGVDSVSIMGVPPTPKRLYLKSDIMSWFPYPPYPAGTTQGYSHAFILDQKSWKFALTGDIKGSNFTVVLLAGCYGSGSAEMKGELFLRHEGSDELLASTPQFTGSMAGFTPIGYQRPSQKWFNLSGKDPNSVKGDTLIFKVTKVGGDRAGLIFIRELNMGHSYIQTPQITKIEEKEMFNLPIAFTLSQNYPNPFNPETTIKYQLPEPSEVAIRIFNITGQVVKTILEEPRPAGYHSVLWDGKDDVGNHVTSGVYFYQLCARTDKLGQVYAETRKMVLVR